MEQYWDKLDEALEVEESRESYFSKSVLLQKSFDFALKIITFCEYLKKDRHFEIASQVLRSGTGIGSNANEATAAVSRKDFVNKIGISAKEARETYYWLLLIDKSEVIQPKPNELIDECDELIRITTAIIKTIRKKSKL